MLELADHILELAVQDDPVGDHHHLVEHLAVLGVVQGRETVSQPGDRVGLARPGRVLHQIVVPRAGCLGVGLQAAHRVPLVEPGEDHRRALLGTLRRLVDMDEAAQDVHPRVPGPHPLPQVGSAVPVRVGRVACPEIVAPVERQEPGLLPRQMGGHGHRVRIHREVHHPHPLQRAVLRVAVLAVLEDGVLDALAGQRVLQLGRRHRDTVHEQAQVDRLVARRVVAELAGHRQHVGLVPLDQLRSQPAGWSEERQPEPHVAVHHPVAEHVHRPPFVELLGQPLHETGLGQNHVAAVAGVHQAIPLIPLGGADELEQIRRIHSGYGVEVGLTADVAELHPTVTTVDELSSWLCGLRSPPRVQMSRRHTS